MEISYLSPASSSAVSGSYPIPPSEGFTLTTLLPSAPPPEHQPLPSYWPFPSNKEIHPSSPPIYPSSKSPGSLFCLLPSVFSLSPLLFLPPLPPSHSPFILSLTLSYSWVQNQASCKSHHHTWAPFPQLPLTQPMVSWLLSPSPHRNVPQLASDLHWVASVIVLAHNWL